MRLFETLRENIVLIPQSNIHLEEVMAGYQRYGTESEIRRYDYHLIRTLGEASDVEGGIRAAISYNEASINAMLEYCNFITGKLDQRAEAHGELREHVLLRGIEESLIDNIPAIHPELCEEATIIGMHAVRHLLEQKNIFSVFTNESGDQSDTINKVNKCLGVEESFFKEAMENTVNVKSIVETLDTAKDVSEIISTTIKEFVIDLENYRNKPRELFEQLDARELNARGEAILATMESFNATLENAFENIFLKAAIVESTNSRLFNTGCSILK